MTNNENESEVKQTLAENETHEVRETKPRVYREPEPVDSELLCLTPRQAMAALGCSRRQLYNLHSKGLRFSKISDRQVRYLRADIERFLRKRSCGEADIRLSA